MRVTFLLSIYKWVIQTHRNLTPFRSKQSRWTRITANIPRKGIHDDILGHEKTPDLEINQQARHLEYYKRYVYIERMAVYGQLLLLKSQSSICLSVYESEIEIPIIS